MSEEQEKLKWGDIVRIHGVNLSKKNQSKGLILSKGFTDSNLYYQKYKDFQDVNFYRESLFQLMPRSNFDVHDQLLDQNLTQQQRQMLTNRTVAEIEGFFANLKRVAGLDIEYGAEVVFRHVESNSYLRGIMKAADSGDGAFKIEVTESLSSQTLFRLKSHRSYVKEGDKIYYDDALLIYHEGADCYMNFAENDLEIPLDVHYEVMVPPEESLEHGYMVERPSIKKPADKRISIINENKSKCLWKFIQHTTFENFDQKTKIKSHDIVYFEHTKNKGMISSALSKKEFCLKESSDQKQYFECFWELIPKEVNELGPENCDFFWVRNIITGEFLEYSGFRVEVKSKDPVEGGGFVNEGLVNLICTEGFNMLERGEPISLDRSQPKIVQYHEEKTTKLQLIDVPELKEDSFCIMRVDEERMMNIQFVVSAHEPIVKFVNIISSENLRRREGKMSFTEMFLRLDEDILANIIAILKLLAGKIYGTSYENIGPSGNTPNAMVQKILVETGFTELLIEILFILYESFKEIEASNEPSSDRAIRNKLSEIFETTYKLLEKVAVGNEDNRIYLSRWVDLFLEHSNNINRSYIQECLVCILQNNPVSIEATINEQKIDELIGSFFAEARRENFLTTKYLRLFSTFIKCEDRVLKENQQIILNKFFKEKQNAWSFKFKLEEKDEDEIQNPLGLPPNDPVYDKILKYRVEIALGKQDFSSIPKFFKDWGPKWNYFLAYINLLADICMDRNSESIENVSALISLQIVVVILNDPDIRALNETIRADNEAELEKTGNLIYPIQNVHEPLIRIAHYIYINNEKFLPIKRIKSISSWYKRSENDDKANKGALGSALEEINHTKRAFEGEKEEEEKCYLMNILAYIDTFIQNCDQDSNNLNILLTVLNLLKETIVLGLWESIEQFRKLIPLLIMRINKIENRKFFEADQETRERGITMEHVNKNKEKLKLNRPELNLGIECKIKTTEIFRLINELEIDIRLRYMMNFFKGLYEATESFEDYNKIAEDRESDYDAVTVERNEAAREEFLKNESASILGDVKRISEDQDIMLKESIWYNKVKELTPFERNRASEDDPHKNRYLFQGHRDLQEQPDFQTMVLAMFELPVFQNHRLLNSSLKMLRQMFEQRKDLVDKFKTILVCGKGNLLEVYLTLKYMRQKFNMLTNLNIIKYKGMEDTRFAYAFFQTYDSGIRDHSKRSGILQDLFFLARTLKEDINLKNIESLMLVEDSTFDSRHVYNHLDEKEKNNNLFQRVNLAEGIYIPLVEYIRIVGLQREIAENHRRVLFGIYNYLTLLCFNNLEAKQILMNYIPDFLPHLSLKVGADNLLYEVCVNNKLLVNNEHLIAQIIDGALDACIHLDSNEFYAGLLSERIDREVVRHVDYEKGKIFHSLRGILLYNDEGHKHNQELLINRLQDNKYKRLIFKGKCEFSSKRENFSLSPEESYIANHFELFTGLVETQNFINIGKLENIHPYPYCLECLKTTNRWQLRRTIRAYVNRLYYVNKDRDIFLFEEFIRKEFKIINEELNDLVELHRAKLITDETPIPNGIRFKFALSEVLEMVLEILITLHEMLLKPEFIRILDREVAKEEKKPENQREIHDQFVKLITNLGCLYKLYPKTKLISFFILEVKKHLAGVMLKFELTYLNGKASSLDEGMPDEGDDLGADTEKKSYVYDYSKSFFRNLNSMIRDIKAQQAREEQRQRIKNRREGRGSGEDTKAELVEQIFQVQGETLKPMKSRKERREIFASQYKPHIQTANSRIFKVIAKPLLGENDENIELNRRLGEVKVIIEDSPSFRKLRDDEFYKLVTTLMNINTISASFYERDWLAVGEKKSVPVVSLREILTNSFALIMNRPTEVHDQEKIFVIKLARCYITEAVEGHQSYKLPVDKWSADYYSGEHDELDANGHSEFVRRQHLIEACGGSDFIISLLSESLTSRTELLNETLLLGIAYLFNGNSKCQNSLYASLRQDSDNKMLVSLRGLIKVIGNYLIEIRRIKDTGKERSFAYKIEDTYDYFDSKENTIVKEFGYKTVDKFESLAEINFEKALCRMFRFLHLFCENNNIDMKKFLLEQTNSDDKRKTNSINFIEEATLLLRKLFKIMNDKVVGIPRFLLDFINEITQLPCIENQRAFIKSTFFEDISYLADFFEDPASILQRKFNPVPEEDDDPYNTLREIYQKGIELALNNFEGNDAVIFREFLSKCQPKFLWICIKQNLLIMLKERADTLELANEEEDQRDSEEARLNRQLLAKFKFNAIQDFLVAEKAASEEFRDEILGVLRVFYIIKTIEDYERTQGEARAKDSSEEALGTLGLRQSIIEVASEEYPQIRRFMELFEKLILSIEISSFNGSETSNQFIYFPNHPVFEYLADNTRDDIMTKVKRETQRDKQVSLIKTKDEVYEEVKLNYNLKYNHVTYTVPVLNYTIDRDVEITSDFGNQIRKMARNTSFLICFLMLFFILIDHDTEEQSSTFTYSNFLSEYLLWFCCKAQLALTLGFLYIWVRLRKPLALKKHDKEKAEAAQKESKLTGGEEQQLQAAKLGEIELEGWESLIKLISRALSFVLRFVSLGWRKIEEHPIYRNTITTFLSLYQYESGFLSILIFVTATFAGNFIGVEWYTIHIFDVFTDISELTNIFKAILDNIQKLTILSILAGVFILVFNVLSLSTYTHVIWEDDLPEESCEDIVGCVLELYTSGAIGDDMDQFEFGRFMFDIGYVVFMEMMFQNIVGGIMIDAFAGLKEQDDFRNEDKETNCYICGMTKADMEKNSETFTRHVKKHFLWNYLYYIYCLEKKDSTDYTGLEFEIDKKITDEDVSWFPAVKSEGDSSDVSEVMAQLEGTIQEMSERSNQAFTKGSETMGHAIKLAREVVEFNKNMIEAA